MKKIIYQSLYKLLSAISAKINNRYLNRYKIAIGTTLLLLTSGCQSAKKNDKNEDNKDSVYTDSIQNETEGDILCYQIIEEPDILFEEEKSLPPPLSPVLDISDVPLDPVTIVDCYVPAVIEDSIPTDGTDENEILIVAEQMPEFPGGVSELMKFIAQNLHYPENLGDISVQGRIIMRVVIEKDGSITNPEILRGLHPDFDKAALEVVNKIPHFKPGIHRGEPVRVRYVFPVSINL